MERSRLLGELDAAFSHPLTLVSASAGSGKTTLLSAWVAASPQVLSRGSMRQSAGQRGAEPACAWLSLDESDNDPIRFWLSVIAAAAHLSAPPWRDGTSVAALATGSPALDHPDHPAQ